MSLRLGAWGGAARLPVEALFHKNLSGRPMQCHGNWTGQPGARGGSGVQKTKRGTLMATVKQLFDLSGKVALITGGSRGLGLQIA